jgi:hypothetical protein
MLLGTSADSEAPENLSRFHIVTFIARYFGLPLVVDRTMKIMFGSSTLAERHNQPSVLLGTLPF